MAQMNMIEAIRSAHDVMMEKDSTVVVLGEDVGYFGGVFRCTDGLQRKYGEPTAEALVAAAEALVVTDEALWGPLRRCRGEESGPTPFPEFVVSAPRELQLLPLARARTHL